MDDKLVIQVTDEANTRLCTCTYTGPLYIQQVLHYENFLQQLGNNFTSISLTLTDPFKNASLYTMSESSRTLWHLVDSSTNHSPNQCSVNCRPISFDVISDMDISLSFQNFHCQVLPFQTALGFSSQYLAAVYFTGDISGKFPEMPDPNSLPVLFFFFNVLHIHTLYWV